MIPSHRTPTVTLTAASVGLVVAIGIAGDRPQAGPVSYALVVDEVRDLGTLSGHLSSEAHAINENGAIAGSSETAAGVRRAVFWPSPTSAPVNLWHLGGGWSEAWGINDAGIVVGNSYAAGSTALRGFRWLQSAGMKDLKLTGLTLGTGPVEWFTAKDINNSSVIVGDFFNGNDVGTAGGYMLGWTVSIVPTCSQWGGLIASDVNAINDQGNFTGSVLCYSGPALVPYFASLTTMTYFPDGGGSSESAGYAINSSNRVVGAWTTPVPTGGYRHHAFRWSPSTGYTDIHPENDTSFESVARGINSNNLIVGRKYHDTYNAAFVYTSGLKMKTLPGLCTFNSFTTSSEAFAVNDAGWVVGKSKTCAGDYHATLWKVRVVVRGAIDGLP